MQYQANPVLVEAHKIVGVGPLGTDGSQHVCLENGENVTATAEMRARMSPYPGDYWVIQADGYVYLNPKDVFERKYSLVKEQG